MSSRGNRCNQSDAIKGVGRKKTTGDDPPSIALLQSKNDDKTRELHRSPQFLTKTIRDQFPTHGVSIEDAFIIAMAGHRCGRSAWAQSGCLPLTLSCQ